MKIRASGFLYFPLLLKNTLKNSTAYGNRSLHFLFLLDGRLRLREELLFWRCKEELLSGWRDVVLFLERLPCLLTIVPLRVEKSQAALFKPKILPHSLLSFDPFQPHPSAVAIWNDCMQFLNRHLWMRIGPAWCPIQKVHRKSPEIVLSCVTHPFKELSAEYSISLTIPILCILHWLKSNWIN